ncbi:peptide deformylase [Rickettsiella grylli]|uniref:Peptide deformylase n=1 Tax=Rickettsiella grylli TaxID=59196 RepID=A8PKU2_9COXI|nr:peptide deformylase [Rickettsiella grylli]EDP46584.1 peptide deformylase [Rickettsiella grylli]OJA00299.1 peptide deformylase [Rickettsiella grylli]
MAIYPIIQLPDVRLRVPTTSITVFDATLQQLIDDMFETMYAAKGIGLAAPQIAISKKLAVIDVTNNKSHTLCLINPTIVEKKGEALLEEGCLSVPGIYDKAPRALWVKLQALDRNGKPYEIEAEGLLAHCIQHEVDHLNGKLFLDHLSPLKQQLARKKLDKIKKRRKY